MADDGESLESWLNKATNPSNRQEDWEYIMGFCDQINKELEGPQISVRLLAHKIQSPQEWEAIQALTVLEACMKNCGRRFHNEVGKFRFLNELIKVVSPKYLGDKVSEKVKSKVIEMLYSWTVSLPDEAKICEAYQMLKSQGIVLVDPEIPLDATLLPSPSPRPKNPVFDDEKKSKELYGDCDKLRQTVFQLATETEDNDSNLGDILQASDDLSQVINSYKKIVEGQTINGETEEAQTQTSVKQGMSRTNQSEILIDLVGLDVQTPSPPEQQPPASSLCFPDDLLCGSTTVDPQPPSLSAPSAALSLLDEELLSLGLNEPVPVDSSQRLHLFDTNSPSGPLFSTPSLFPDALSTTIAPVSTTKSSTTASALGFPGPVLFTPPVFTQSISTTSVTFSQPLSSVLTTVAPTALPQSFSMALSAPSATHVTPQQVSTSPEASHSAPLNDNLQDLALLDLGSPKRTPAVMDFGSLLVKNEDLCAPATLSSNLGFSSTTSTSMLVGGMQGSSTPSPAKRQADDSPLLRSLSPILPLSQASAGMGQEVSLTNVFVPLDVIKPSKVCPVTAYDKNGVRVLLHFATECPAGRPDVLVIVASMLNTAPQPVRSIVLQAAVPKTMKVRLQPPSGTELAPFNPILPPAAITQVMLLANPLKEKVRMRYKLTFTLGEQPLIEVGEVNEFPPADRWGAL
ncbi:ADP-ribosylation factor-binding protein GGA3-like isoform X3 [Seriola dumerili]|uniref:ADP-ribosylation factor-binding protein GGA3-like isoform X3 n=1 Tax=Seriola dumerili TaxID=41447 RepID=UPI000BBE334F|nr:ADP-ribosylation factor-binding protein GGA3-like isoform X3 [Seriola dumerili]